jgi:hypothetical protein
MVKPYVIQWYDKVSYDFLGGSEVDVSLNSYQIEYFNP